jgi:hypothetical protein
MAIRGRKPKPPGQVRHRNKLAHEWIEVENVPFKGGPRLPSRRWNGRAWSPRTRQAWKAWSSMPHCMLWRPSDWEFALDTIELAALFHDGETKVAAELRARQKVLGMTWEALRDQRIRYVYPKSQNGKMMAGVTNIADFRDL